MKLNRILCGATAALTVLSAAAMPAFAEENQLKLLTAKQGGEVPAAANISYGEGYFFAKDNNFYRIGDAEITKWQETGKFACIAIESDLDMTDMLHWSGNFNGEYIQLCRMDADENVTERHVVHLDKENGKISEAYTLPTEWCYTNPNGYTLSNDKSGTTLTVNVYDPTGKKTSATLTCDVSESKANGDHIPWSVFGSAGGKYVGYAAFPTKDTSYEFEDNFDGKIYAIKINGELEEIYKDESFAGMSIIGAAPNAVMYRVDQMAAVRVCIYSAETGKTYISSKWLSDGDAYAYIGIQGLSGKLYGTKAIIRGTDENEQNLYVLVNLVEEENFKVLSKAYTSMSTEDGKIYLVQTENGKWGYIDANGKELAIFDDAGDFCGDFAPVVKNGKGYLIDRNMNKVSDEIDADSVSTISENLFQFKKGEEQMFVTSTKNSAYVPTTSEPTSTPAASEPASTDGKNPATGIALAFVPIAVVGAAVIAVSKKRK